MPRQNRFWYAITTLCVIGIGLASRQYQGLFPVFMGKYPGDALWALMVFLGLGFFFPKTKILQRAAYALAISYWVEGSQLYRAPWIDNIRSHKIGHLVLGQGFNWGDLLAYALGIVVGVLGEQALKLAITKLRS
jgi:hypothetical protein